MVEQRAPEFDPQSQRLLRDALAFALEAHEGQTRKGKPVPYVSHLLQVSGLVLEYGGGVTEAVAALLHDSIEDCPGVDVNVLRERFGARVAELVLSLTDTLEGDTPTSKSRWRDRKDHYLSNLRSADRSTRLIAGCDKLHNLRDVVGDLRREGIATLDRFTATPPQTLWYYREVRRVIDIDVPDALAAELDALLAELAETLEKGGFAEA